MRLSTGKVRVSSTSSFSSSGFAGLLAGFDDVLSRELAAMVCGVALGVGGGVATSTGVTDGVSLREGCGVATITGVAAGVRSGAGLGLDTETCAAGEGSGETVSE